MQPVKLIDGHDDNISEDDEDDVESALHCDIPKYYAKHKKKASQDTKSPKS